MGGIADPLQEKPGAALSLFQYEMSLKGWRISNMK